MCFVQKCESSFYII